MLERPLTSEHQNGLQTHRELQHDEFLGPNNQQEYQDGLRGP